MRTRLCGLAALLILVPSMALAEAKKEKKMSVLSYKMKSIDGKDVDLSNYKGKVVLFVNVASKCGKTPQYKGLQELHDKYAKEGLAIIGVPANEFGKQEPGSNEEIAQFCSSKYNVKFDMLGKVVVKGEGICPLYQHLTSKETDPKFGGDVKWNFTKFLISKDGKIVGRFEPNDEPTSEKVTSAIEDQLKK